MKPRKKLQGCLKEKPERLKYSSAPKTILILRWKQMVAYKLSCKAEHPSPLTGSREHDPVAAMELRNLFLKHGRKAVEALNKITGGKDFPIDLVLIRTMELMLNEKAEGKQPRQGRGDSGFGPFFLSIEGCNIDLAGERDWARAFNKEPLEEGILP